MPRYIFQTHSSALRRYTRVMKAIRQEHGIREINLIRELELFFSKEPWEVLSILEE